MNENGPSSGKLMMDASPLLFSVCRRHTFVHLQVFMRMNQGPSRKSRRLHRRCNITNESRGFSIKQRRMIFMAALLTLERRGKATVTSERESSKAGARQS